MARAVKFDHCPPKGTRVEWGGVSYTLDFADVGMHFGNPFTRLNWQSPCIGCGKPFAQSSSMNKAYLRKRCAECNGPGDKDRDDRVAYLADRPHGAKRPAVTAGFTIENAEALLAALRAGDTKTAVAAFNAMIVVPVEAATFKPTVASGTPNVEPHLLYTRISGRAEREGGRVTYTVDRLNGTPLTWTREPGEDIPAELEHLVDAIAAADLMGGVS